MIKKLKVKFIILSMTSLFALLALIVTGMNVINYCAVVKEADEILSILAQNKGTFPDFKEENMPDRLPPDLSPELPYESRYFSVLLDSFGHVLQTETSRIASIDPAMSIQYAMDVMKNNDNRGFVDKFRFVRYYEGGAIRITFLDCRRKIDSFYQFLYASSGMALAGFIIVFFVILFFAGKIIRPISESYEKQKRFITDAGHEIKTPLTIINANAEVLETEIGPNECLTDIRQQIKRLTSLTNDLIYLARMEESDNPLPMIEFPISEIVCEAASSFEALAQTQEKEFVRNVQPMLSMKGNSKAIEQLVFILMDNALKYSPQGSRISLDFVKQNKTLCLTVLNTTRTSISEKDLSRVFDRFYRTDLSRSIETGGHGIGLSVAKAIVTAHGGRIQAQTTDGYSFQITVLLPA